jgi:hypothetical protein
MNRFTIVQDDPLNHREEILRFWKEYLPGAPPKRLEWLIEGNPVGQTVWFFAFGSKTNALAGTISIMPRKIKISNKEYKAGIVGDFMVAKEHRAFGPALPIMKAVIGDYQRLGFDFLYTVPNPQSEALAHRAGFTRIGTLKRFTKVLNPGYKLQGRMPRLLSTLLAPGANMVCKLFSRDAYTTSRLDLKKYTEQNAEGSFCIMGKADLPYIMGDRSNEYMRWRYFQNPLYKCNIFGYSELDTDQPLGCVVVTMIGENAHVLDFMFHRTEAVEPILLRFLKDMRKNGCGAVSVRMLEGSPLQERLERLGFYERKETAPLLFVGKPFLSPTEWLFFDGDRNV